MCAQKEKVKAAVLQKNVSSTVINAATYGYQFLLQLDELRSVSDRFF